MNSKRSNPVYFSRNEPTLASLASKEPENHLTGDQAIHTKVSSRCMALLRAAHTEYFNRRTLVDALDELGPVAVLDQFCHHPLVLDDMLLLHYRVFPHIVGSTIGNAVVPALGHGVLLVTNHGGAVLTTSASLVKLLDYPCGVVFSPLLLTNLGYVEYSLSGKITQFVHPNYGILWVFVIDGDHLLPLNQSSSQVELLARWWENY